MVVSKGFDGAEAVKFNESGSLASFRCGFSRYDKRAEGNKRWENVQCKAFGEVAQRVKGMKLSAKARINISGTFDFDSWEKDGKTQKAPVFIVEDIEYANSLPKGEKNDAAPAAAAAPAGDTYEVVDDDDLPFN